MEQAELKLILEGALMAAGRPLSVREMGNLFDPVGAPDAGALRSALEELSQECEARAYELKETGSGWRFQVRSKYGVWVSRLWEEKPPRYSRALLETLSLVAYKQPLTRGEIEEVRGVAVSTNIIRTLLDRNWVRVVGHRDVPGKPAMYATTREFLDYFNLKNLSELPNLAEIKEISALNPELDLQEQRPQGRSIEMPVEEDAEGIAESAESESAEAETPESEQVEAGTGEQGRAEDSAQDESLGPADEGIAEGEPAEGEPAEGEPADQSLRDTGLESEHGQDVETDTAALVPEPDDVDPDSDFRPLPN